MSGVVSDEFTAASSYVSGASVPSVSDDNKLALYAHFKQGTVGDCNTSKPGMFDFAGKAKWSAWKKLAGMPSDTAQTQYVELVTQLFPSWREGIPEGSAAKSQGGGGSGGGGMAPRVSRPMVQAEEGDADMQGPEGETEIFALARDGDVEGVRACLARGITPNASNAEGSTPLHYAADGGHVGVVNTLISGGADVDAQDADGQTALHYAAICDYVDVYQALIQAGADDTIRDNDQETPLEGASSAFRKAIRGVDDDA